MIQTKCVYTASGTFYQHSPWCMPPDLLACVCFTIDMLTHLDHTKSLHFFFGKNPLRLWARSSFMPYYSYIHILLIQEVYLRGFHREILRFTEAS